MTDRIDPENAPGAFADLPLQPTGSGVADLEIAYEQMKLSAEADQDDGRVAHQASSLINRIPDAAEDNASAAT